jgi:hypothetical protein
LVIFDAPKPLRVEATNGASIMRKIFTCNARREQAMLVIAALTLIATIVAIFV